MPLLIIAPKKWSQRIELWGILRLIRCDIAARCLPFKLKNKTSFSIKFKFNLRLKSRERWKTIFFYWTWVCHDGNGKRYIFIVYDWWMSERMWPVLVFSLLCVWEILNVAILSVCVLRAFLLKFSFGRAKNIKFE